MNVLQLAAQLEEVDLTGKDVQRVAGGRFPVPVVLYSDLARYSTIDELLSGPSGAVILLWQTVGKRIGHWTCLFRALDGLEYWDSYGFAPDEDKHKATFDTSLPPYLSRLLATVPGGYTHNKFDYQTEGPNINTCGRWVGARLRTRYLFTAAQFQALFSGGMALGKDVLVALLTLLLTLTPS